MKRFQDKVVIITGASRGIGKATALEFAKAGANIVIDYFVSDYEPDALENTQLLERELKDLGVRMLSISADVRDEKQVQSLVDNTLKEFGRIDILVNNAGIVEDKPLQERTLEDWHKTIDTNLIGTFICSKTVAPIMKKQKYGRIVNVASTNGIDAISPESIDYDASKAGVISLTKNLALELAPDILVNAVAPGWVDTPMNDQLSSNCKAVETKKIYLKRFARDEEIARPILFLASEEASYITGEILVVNGGM